VLFNNITILFLRSGIRLGVECFDLIKMQLPIYNFDHIYKFFILLKKGKKSYQR
jgi:hypothetical protein